MPHDQNGQELKPGDTVTIEFEVKAVHAAQDFCNCDLVPVIPMPGQNAYQGSYSFNTKQTAKKES